MPEHVILDNTERLDSTLSSINDELEELKINFSITQEISKTLGVDFNQPYQDHLYWLCIKHLSEVS